MLLYFIANYLLLALTIKAFTPWPYSKNVCDQKENKFQTQSVLPLHIKCPYN